MDEALGLQRRALGRRRGGGEEMRKKEGGGGGANTRSGGGACHRGARQPAPTRAPPRTWPRHARTWLRPAPLSGTRVGGTAFPLPPLRGFHGSTAPGEHGVIRRGKATEALWSANPREVLDPTGWVVSCGVCVVPEGYRGILAL